ncbi:MAG TPA: hypothetical protein VE870_05665 [Bacteroidales bacterium]|nr:hypothetical protein [Bacteroidales bacterium]
MENSNRTAKSLLIILIVLSVALVIVSVIFFVQKKKSNDMITQLQEYSSIVTEKKDSLESELNHIIVRYDSLMTNNDSLNTMLVEQQNKIKRLLSLRVNDAEKIRKYEKELGTIRDVLRSYIVQIDSLNTRNQILTAENKQLRNKTVETENKNKQLQQEKEELTSIKDVATTLIAANVEAVPLNKRSREKDKFDKVEKIRVDFMIRKNTVAEAGPKVIYLRIIRPDGVVLGSSDAGVITSGDQEIPYSASREIIYENQDIPVSIFWDNNGDLIAGTYKVELYAEGKMIGETEFSLT